MLEKDTDRPLVKYIEVETSWGNVIKIAEHSLSLSSIRGLLPALDGQPMLEYRNLGHSQVKGLNSLLCWFKPCMYRTKRVYNAVKYGTGIKFYQEIKMSYLCNLFLPFRLIANGSFGYMKKGPSFFFFFFGQFWTCWILDHHLETGLWTSGFWLQQLHGPLKQTMWIMGTKYTRFFYWGPKCLFNWLYIGDLR